MRQEGVNAQAAEQCFFDPLNGRASRKLCHGGCRAATSLTGLRRDRGEVAQARDLLAAVSRRFSEGFATAALQIAKALIRRTVVEAPFARALRARAIERAGHHKNSPTIHWLAIGCSAIFCPSPDSRRHRSEGRQ